MAVAEVTLVLAGAVFVTLIFAVFFLCKDFGKKKKINGYYELFINDPDKISFKKVKTQIPVTSDIKKKYPWSTPTEKEFELKNAVVSIVRNSDLRSHSEQSKGDKDNSPCENDSLDNDVEYISTDSLLSDSDQSWSNFSATSVECNKKHLHGIKKRIASNRRNNQTRLLKKKKIGTIAMKTKFLSSTNTLEVWISQVMYFNNKKQNCCHSFFVLLSLMPEKMQAQTSKRVKDRKIKIIKDNKIKKLPNKVIGEAQIPVTDLCYSSEESSISFDLFPRSKASLGSINISLCHQATVSKLNVIIIQAKSLPKFSNPYVTVSLFREETIEMKNTSTKYNMHNPIFNELIEFDISTDVSNSLSVYTMVVTVNDSSFLGKNRVIGHVIFSLFSPQKSALTHWQIVQSSPYQSHSEWHTLVDPNEI